MAEENQIITLKLNNHKTPQFKEQKGKDWIVYGTEQPFYNQYPRYLLELFLNSTFQNAIVKAKHRYIIGNGIEIDKRGLKVGQIADLKDKTLQANKYRENITDIASKCVLDRLIYGGAYIEVIWAKDGKTIAEFYHRNYNSLRRDKDEKGYLYSDNWSTTDQSFEKTKYEFIPEFDPKNPKGKQIYAYREYTPDLQYYPVPDYKGAIPYIEADVEIGNFDLNRIKTGFFVGTILNFIGNPTPEEKKALEKSLKEKFTGTDATNSIMLVFGRDKDHRPEILRLSPDELDQQFQTLKKSIEQNICSVHHFNPMLAGIKTEGQLGGRSELEVSYQLANNTVIEPIQTQMENWFNYLCTFKGLGEKRIKFLGVKPLNLFTPEQMWEEMTGEERREAMGLPRLADKKSTVQMSKITPDEMPDEDEEDEEDIVMKDMELFKQYGVSEDECDVFGGLEIEFKATGNYSVIDSDNVKNIYRNVLELLTKDPLMDNESLAKALKTSPEKISKAVEALVEAEAIKIGSTGKGDLKVRQIKVLPAGESVLSEQGSQLEALEVRYRYEAKDGLKPIIPGTRAFCREMLSLKRLWSREDIQQLSSKVGYNVWTDRGGWWTREGTTITTKNCRHVFKQVLVRKKKR